MEHYDVISNFIKTYNLTHEEDIFTRGIEKNVFITLADSVCEIVDDENHNDTKIDYNSVVENTYNKIFVPIIRNLIDVTNRRRLMRRGLVLRLRNQRIPSRVISLSERRQPDGIRQTPELRYR